MKLPGDRIRLVAVPDDLAPVPPAGPGQFIQIEVMWDDGHANGFG